MSKLTNLIFNNANHYVTSKFGYRKSFDTKGGATSSFHNGTDYGTNSEKIPQYAVENGVILSAGTDGYGGKYAWIKYPRLNVKMLHYHLDSVKVKVGQNVSKGTLIGYTGMSGKATGVHLHLSIVNLANGQYLDPEAYNYSEAPIEEGFLPAKGYFCFGDKGDNVEKINDFYYRVFPGYAKKLKRDAKNVKGPLFGNNTVAWTKEFQRRCKADGIYDDNIDGNFGKKTYKCAQHHGFKY